jgi:hypothetical protein
MGDLEGRVDRELLVKLCPSPIKEVIGDMRHFAIAGSVEWDPIL